MLKSDFDRLLEAYDLRIKETRQLQQRILTLEEENARLKELLRLQTSRLFGKSSEGSAAPDVPSVTQECDAESTTTPAPPEETKTIEISKHVRVIKPRGKRQTDNHEIPTFTVIHSLSPDEEICACCNNHLHIMGQDKSKQLEIIPVQYCFIEHVRLKYACRSCETVVMAPKPPAPLPKAIGGPSLLTDVIVSKYQYHLPLYRQSKIMKSHGVTVSDKTLANWVIELGKALMPMYEAMWVILQNRYLQVDETPVKVLDTNNKGYIWAYYAPNMQQGLVAFEFQRTREGRHVQERLKSFNGLLQTDGYAGYDALRQRKGITGFGCLTHARRKFKEVVKIKGQHQGIAAEMIQRLQPLYELEARMRDMPDITHRTRKRLRQKIAWPILKKIHQWLRLVSHGVPPKSQLGKAMTYTLNQWHWLTAYTRHGMAEIDTNHIENNIRTIALGKKNWLSIGNEDCGKIHALWYTLIISAMINDLNPRVYIHYLLTKIHDIRRGVIDPISLLPDRIDIKALESFAREQIEIGRAILNNMQFTKAPP